jgi:hypothetical protein
MRPGTSVLRHKNHVGFSRSINFTYMFFLVLNVRMMSLISYRFQQLPTTNAQTIQKSQQSINRQL